MKFVSFFLALYVTSVPGKLDQPSENNLSKPTPPSALSGLHKIQITGHKYHPKGLSKSEPPPNFKLTYDDNDTTCATVSTNNYYSALKLYLERISHVELVVFKMRVDVASNPRLLITACMGIQCKPGKKQSVEGSDSAEGENKRDEYKFDTAESSEFLALIFMYKLEKPLVICSIEAYRKQ